MAKVAVMSLPREQYYTDLSTVDCVHSYIIILIYIYIYIYIYILLFYMKEYSRFDI